MNDRAREGRELPVTADPLLGCLLIVARRHGLVIGADAAVAGLPLPDGQLTPSLFHRAAQRAGLASRVARVDPARVNLGLLPAVVLLRDGQACVLLALDTARGVATVIHPELDEAAMEMPLSELRERSLGRVIYVRPSMRFDARTPTARPSRSGHWFWRVIADNRRLYRDVLLAAALINVFAVAMPLFVMNVYDRVVPNHATDTLWVLAAGVAVVLCADALLRVMRSWFIDLAATRADSRLSARLMEQVLDLRMEARPASAGSFASNLQSFEFVRAFIGSATVVALVDLPFVLLFALAIGLIGWPLVVPVLAGALIVLLAAATVQRRLHDLAETTRRAGAQRNATLVESLVGLETVKAFGAQGAIQAVWERTTDFLSRHGAAMRLHATAVGAGAQWCQHAVAVAIVVIGVYMVIQGDLSQGGLIAAYLLSSRAMAPIAQAAGLLTQYHQSATALAGLDEVMKQPVERPQGRGWTHRGAVQGGIEFKGVDFRYPGDDRLALKALSLRINPGERVALLGRVGSGKTTIEKLVLGLYEPAAGTVLIDGIDQRQIDPAELRRHIGYVPQDVVLFYGTLRENIALGLPHASDEDILSAVRVGGLQGFVDAHPLGLDLPVGERGELLSGGQRQGVAIARAALRDPAIVLLDEPTGSMDHASEEEIKRNLASFAAGRTLVVVTHRTALLDLVERVVVLDAGRIVADGPKAQVVEALRSGRIGRAS